MVKRLYLFIIILLAGMSDIFAQDITPPAPVTIKFVTVNPTNGDVTIKWNPSSSVDVDTYRIYKVIGGVNKAIGDVNHPTTTYINTASNIPADTNICMANSRVETYLITASDDAPPPGPNQSQLSAAHHTIYLESIFDTCFSKIRLSWNHYDTWLSGVFDYDIYLKIGTGPWNILATVDGDINSFVDHNLIAEKDYSYYVVAHDGTGGVTSTSNKVSVYTDMDLPPVDFLANYASVVSENNIEISFTVDLAAEVSKYKILRTDDLGGDFDTIAVFDAPSLTSNIVNYIDHAPTNIVHYYTMVAFNKTCNVTFPNPTNFASNIVLTGYPDNDMRNYLTWTNYFKWGMGISYFEVLRTIDINTEVIVGQIPYGDTTFYDKVDQFVYDPTYNPLDPLDEINKVDFLGQPVLSGKVCYRVKAYEGSGASLGTFSSYSNSICVVQEPRVFIPNAFSPNFDGINDLFYPYVSFAGLNNYEFIIFDRWGQIVFQTNTAHEPWTGIQIKDEKMAPPGAYVYYLKFEDGDKKSHMYKGDVVLIR